MGNVKSQRQLQRQQTKEKSFQKFPLKDRMVWSIVRYIIKMILQVIIFLMFYGWLILPQRETWFATAPVFTLFYRISMPELGGVFILLIISDAIARLFCWVILLIYAWSRGYIIPSKSHKPVYVRPYIEYLIYVFLRALFYATGFIWILTASLYPTTGASAFLLAWILISLGSRAIAKLIGIKAII